MVEVFIQLNMININPSGPFLFNVLVDNETLEPPVLQYSSDPENIFTSIVSKYFNVDPAWILDDLSLSWATYENQKITLIYTCSVPRLSCVNGHFVCITDYNKFKESIQNLKGSNV